MSIGVLCSQKQDIYLKLRYCTKYLFQLESLTREIVFRNVSHDDSDNFGIARHWIDHKHGVCRKERCWISEPSDLKLKIWKNKLCNPVVFVLFI